MESRPSSDENSFGNGNTVEENDGASMQRTRRVRKGLLLGSGVRRMLVDRLMEMRNGAFDEGRQERERKGRKRKRRESKKMIQCEERRGRRKVLIEGGSRLVMNIDMASNEQRVWVCVIYMCARFFLVLSVDELSKTETSGI